MNYKERKKYIFAQLRGLPNATQYVEVTKYFENLEQQCKKQKEVIDKAINNSQYWIDYYTRLNSDERIALRLQENLDILKEVSE